MRVGLDVLLQERIDLVRGRRVGLIVNPTSLNSQLLHAAHLFQAHPEIELAALFGPQHGIRGETQDNMIEWRGWHDSALNVPVHSLYGATRVPTPEMLRPVELLVYDIQDVGTRVYTFIYTLAHCMIAAAEHDRDILVLDRPNPIGGISIEGNILDPGYASFVGMYPLPMRHGMTVGELARMFNQAFNIHARLEVVPMEGWRREMWFDDTGLTWVLPSPNMPTLDAATVYPGTVMMEGTELSEGRGTTRPFEFIGAPFVEPDRWARRLAELNLPGVLFRACYFEPTYQKFQGKMCGGVQLHVTDRGRFRPVITGVALIRTIRELYPTQFRWKSPPYEYVFDRLPFDVINGGPALRDQIESGCSLDEIQASWARELGSFAKLRKRFLLYE